MGERINCQACRNARFIVLLKMQGCYFKNKSLPPPQWKDQHSSFSVQAKVAFYNRREYYISLNFKMWSLSPCLEMPWHCFRVLRGRGRKCALKNHIYLLSGSLSQPSILFICSGAHSHSHQVLDFFPGPGSSRCRLQTTLGEIWVKISTLCFLI